MSTSELNWSTFPRFMTMHVTQLLHRLQAGDQDAMNVLIPLVYDELKKLAKAHLRREFNSITLQTTALVHETFLRLAGSQHPSYENRAHFYGIASRLMRQVLVDTARAKAAEKRAAREVRLADVPDEGPRPDRTLLALDDALHGLEKTDPQKARLIEMRYFVGMTAEESSMALSIPVHVVRRDLRLAKAWLRREMALIITPPHDRSLGASVASDLPIGAVALASSYRG